MDEFRVALVDPPFGSAAVPSLGLALLAGGVKRLGIPTRTFFWNLDFARLMFGELDGRKLRSYQSLTGRTWYPFNEWIFARAVHGDRLDEREPATRQAMRERAAGLTRPDVPLSRILKLREMADEIVDAMCDRLSTYPVVGIGTTFFQNLPALALARRLKQRWPEKHVVLGGANCDGGMGRTLLEQFPFVDSVFSGEVDHAFPEFARRLAQGLSLNGIPGLHRRGAENPPAEPIADMESLPVPDFEDYVEARREAGIHPASAPMALPLESSRGCWWGERQHCTFCGLNANGMKYRRKQPERFQWEVEEIRRRYRATYVFVTDNILAMDYYDTFLEWSANSSLDLRFFYEIKANIKRRHAERLSAGGVTAIQPGIEHFSTTILNRMRKGVSGIQNVALLKYAREEGITLTYNLLAGFPDEERDEYARMIRQFPKLAHLRPPAALAEVEYHRFSPYHSEPQKYGLQLAPSSHYQALYPFDRDTVSRIAYFFEHEGPRPERSYLRPVYEAMMAWAREFREDDCTLTWTAGAGGSVEVDDRRSAFGPRRLTLAGLAARLFHFLDEPQSERAIARFIQQEGDVTLEKALLPLAQAGLLYEEDRPSASGDLTTLGAPAGVLRYYLALPVRAQRRPADPGWLALGV